ncbi:hypothetical protein [Arthrobacter sp. 9AX]|uniref:hypothetical protein n=1 Tax=Arthrobacter sp. 9AX TaxID=2653131 RepID=UPI00135AC940|nr:hypothetical protein [Arthrobacter sp. 9AX]
MENWIELIPSDTVVLINQETSERHKGNVDAVSDDGSSLWLILENARGRKRTQEDASSFCTLTDTRPSPITRPTMKAEWVAEMTGSAEPLDPAVGYSSRKPGAGFAFLTSKFRAKCHHIRVGEQPLSGLLPRQY